MNSYISVNFATFTKQNLYSQLFMLLVYSISSSWFFLIPLNYLGLIKLLLPYLWKRNTTNVRHVSYRTWIKKKGKTWWTLKYILFNNFSNRLPTSRHLQKVFNSASFQKIFPTEIVEVCAIQFLQRSTTFKVHSHPPPPPPKKKKKNLKVSLNLQFFFNNLRQSLLLCENSKPTKSLDWGTKPEREKRLLSFHTTPSQLSHNTLPCRYT